MEEEKKTSNKSSKTSSEVQKVKKTTKKNINKNISNDELLEQILNKKNNKKKKTEEKKKVDLKKDTSLNKNILDKEKNKRKGSTNTNKKKTNNKINKANIDISNDELFESIKAKKKSKKVKAVDKDSVNSEIVKKIVSKNIDEDKEIDVSVSKVQEVKEEKKNDVISNENIENIVDIDSSILSKNPSISDNTESMIITRELNFDVDKFDIKNKELLRELRDAIREYDLLDDLNEQQEQDNIEEEQKSNIPDKKDILETSQIVLNGKRSDRYKKSSVIDEDDIVEVVIDTEAKKNQFKLNLNDHKIKKYFIFGCLIFLLFIFLVLGIYFVNKNNSLNNNLEGTEFVEKEEEPDFRPQLYQECLNRALDESDRTDSVIQAESELEDYLSTNYDVSVLYEDLSLGYSFRYNTEEVYYAASTMKTLGALYIYTKASAGEIDLNDTMTYTSKYKWGSSAEMSKLDYGTEVTLRDLVKFSITVSDNSAHQMIVSYIGRKNLKEYGKSLGATYTLSGSDNFGNINVEDAIIYVKALNDFINNNGELGEELKSYFVNASQNDLAMPDLNIQAAHKYGQYKSYYHDIGIVYAEKPYVVAILTREGSGDFEEKVKDISRKIYNLHQLYNSNREEICKLEIYGS